MSITKWLLFSHTSPTHDERQGLGVKFATVVGREGASVCLEWLRVASQPIIIMGMSVQPLPLKLNDANALKRLREIATDSARVIFTRHAKQRMKQRRITTAQVLACLSAGSIAEPAHIDQFGAWVLTVEKLTAGELVRVAVAMMQNERGDWVTVITVTH
jgi:hypothetical protein